MNRNQLATLAEANEIKAKLGSMGGGVTDIYVPPYGAPFAPPQDGDAMFYHLTFANGATGFNVGLIRVTIKNNPTRWPLMLATEIEAAGRAAREKE